MVKRPKAISTFSWPRLAALAMALSIVDACSPRTPTVFFSAAPELRPRLEDIERASPLPPGIELGSEKEASVSITLVAGADSTALGGGAAIAEDAGLLWLAAPLPLADPRYDLGAKEARAAGLLDLGRVVLPERAARIEGRWPGEAGYPFAEPLLLAARARRGRLPARLGAWLRAAAARSAAESAPVSLAATGDLEVGPGEARFLLQGDAGLAKLLDSALLTRLRSSDILVGNLEGQITSGGSPDPQKHYHFRFPPGTGEAYRSMGFDLLLLGNNHSLDFGIPGLLETFSDLASAGIPYVGAGKNEDEALALRSALGPASEGILFIGLGAFPDEALGFKASEAAALSNRPGINVDLDATLAAIRKAAASGKVVVALVHGGREFSSAPDEATRRLFRRLADAGAALVIGSHPHVLQGVEARGSSLIAYSLGNFLFTGRVMPADAQRSAVASFLLYRGAVRGIDVYPVLVTPSGTYTDPRRDEAQGRFSALSAGLNDSTSLSH